jgi:hypothetical protein
MSQNGCHEFRHIIQPQEASPVNQHIRVLGIDIATQVSHLVGMDGQGQ